MHGLRKLWYVACLPSLVQLTVAIRLELDEAPPAGMPRHNFALRVHLPASPSQLFRLHSEFTGRRVCLT